MATPRGAQPAAAAEGGAWQQQQHPMMYNMHTVSAPGTGSHLAHLAGLIPLEHRLQQQQSGAGQMNNDEDDEADGEGGDDTGDDEDYEGPPPAPHNAFASLRGHVNRAGPALAPTGYHHNGLPTAAGTSRSGQVNGSQPVYSMQFQTPAPNFVTPAQINTFVPTQGEPAWSTWLPPSSPSPNLPTVTGNPYIPSWAAGFPTASTFPPSTSLPNAASPSNAQAGTSAGHYLNTDAFRNLVSPGIARAAQEQDEYESGNARDNAQRSTTARTDADGDHRMRSASVEMEQEQAAAATGGSNSNAEEEAARRTGRSRRDTIKQSNFQQE